MIKINPLDAHDRYLHFTKQSFSIADCVDDLIKQRPFGNHAFYIFAHTRTDEDGLKKRLIWQPRLTKPKSQTNSMLFKAYPGTETIKIIWMIPARELWAQYEKGKVAEHNETYISIQNFLNNRQLLDAPEKDDLSDEQINEIYKDLSTQVKYNKMMESLYIKPKNEGASLIF